jgi:hypothetical protein
MQVIIGDTDVTKYVQEKSYKVDSVDDYNEWKDAGKHLHRGGYVSRVQGSFELVFIDGYEGEDAFGDFLALIAENSTDKRLTMSVTVGNLNNELKQIVCYYDLQTNSMRWTKNGSNVVVKRILMTFEER